MNENSYTPLKKLTQIIALTILFSVFLSFASRSQLNNIYKNGSMAEKIYLQLDSKVYTMDQTIWFKSIVANAFNHTPTVLSGVLYVELIGPDEKIIEKKLIKLVDGIGDGFFQLVQEYSEGLYLIRAYTEWNKNFGVDFFFKEYFRVFPVSAKEKAEPINNIILEEKQDNKRRLKSYFNPLAIDSLHKKELTLFITLGNKKDTLSIKKNKDDKYLVDYVIPDECQIVTLQIQTGNLFSYSKTIVLDEDYLDLQFFPESGELVHGINGKVGFKALSPDGKGKSVEGTIVNGQGEAITFFKSNQLGMGSFILSNVDSNATYFAKVNSKSEEDLSLMYPLPEIASKGNVFSVSKIKDNINLVASSNYLKNDSIYFRASSRGVVYYNIKGRLNEGVLMFSLPANEFPEGIIAFTMMDSLMSPLAERLYFNERPESRINIALSTDKDTYTQRELTRLNIETMNNDGEAVNANLSLLVLNNEQMGKLQSTRQNILSYFLLDSELEGEIENPGFYFSKNNNRHNHLDALLLTQGWRKYHYAKPVDKILFQPEPCLSISGSVSGAFSRRRKKEIELTMMYFNPNPAILTQTTDNLGRFKFNMNDEYGQYLNVVIHSAKKSGKKMNYTIAKNKKESPPVSFNHIKSVEKVDSVVHTLVSKNIEREMVEKAFQISNGVIPIEEVVVEGYHMTPEREEVMKKYGKPDRVIQGAALLEKEEKWSGGLSDVLKYNFPELTKINRIHGTIVVVDGIPIDRFNYVLIGGIPMNPFSFGVVHNNRLIHPENNLLTTLRTNEVSSFEIIENAKHFPALYREVFFVKDTRLNGSPDEIFIDRENIFNLDKNATPMSGNVIAIYTHAGNGLVGRRDTWLIHAAVPVFSPPREFYAPKYKNIKSDDWHKPDLRALVHWEPKIMVNSLGKASATFYNADNIGKMKVIVEAISETGEIGYQEIVYDIGKRK